MILSLFSWLSDALNQNAFIALFASFVWGVLSVLLSPCHLASIPLIVGFIDDQGEIKTKRAFVLSVLFSTGILVTIFCIGVITSLMGRMLGDIGAWGNYLVAVVFFVVGLSLLGVIPLSFSSPDKSKMKRKGLIAAFILGLVFGIALGPCSFAYMAPVLGVTFASAKTNMIYAVALLAVYGVGHCSVIVLAGTFAEIMQHYLSWNKKARWSFVIKKICGLLVIAGGLYLIFTAKC